MKVCNKCKESKPFNEFYKRSGTKDGLVYACKKCLGLNRNEDYLKEYRQRPYVKERQKKYLEKYRVEYRKKPEDKQKRKEYSIKRLYNITIDEYNKILKSQNNCCAICNQPKDSFKRSLDVDHNHETREIRGLLCSDHNKGLGLFQDNPELLRNAANYLEKNYGREKKDK